MGRPSLIVEVALGTDPDAFEFFTLDDPVRGVLGSNELAEGLSGDSGLWVNLTQEHATYAGSVSTTRGRRRQLEQYEAGTVTVHLDNSDRRFDPTNLDGPYVLGGVSQVQPMKPVRIRAVHNGVTYNRLYGFADSWDISWAGPGYSEAVLKAKDGFKILTNFDPLEVSPVGAGEDSGARIERVLDNAGWSADQRDIDEGTMTLQATNLSSNALSELKLVADTELGSVYVDAAGNLVFRNATSRYTSERSAVSQATYGDADDEFNYEDLTIAYDADLVRNRAQIARVGGTQQVVDDVVSQAKYLIHTHNRTDLLMQSDEEALDYATQIVNLNAEADLRFESMTVAEPMPDDMWAAVLTHEIGDRITIRRRPPGGGDTIERDCFIEGISENAPAEGRGKWSITFQLSDAAGFAAFTLEDPVLGVLGSNYLAFGGGGGTGGELGGSEGGYGGGYGGGY